MTCTVSTWTNTSAHLSSVGGYYGYNGEFVVNKGDKVAMQIWNVQTGAGPAIALVTAGAVSV